MAAPRGNSPWLCRQCSYGNNSQLIECCEVCRCPRDASCKFLGSPPQPSLLTGISNFLKKTALIGTCATAAAVTAASAVGSKQAGGLCGFCSTAIAALAGAALSLEAASGGVSDMIISSKAPLTRRKRVAAITRPTAVAAVGAPDSATRASSSVLQQLSAGDGHSFGQDQLDILEQSNPDSSGSVLALERISSEQPLELLRSYGAQVQNHHQDLWTGDAPRHILLAHQRLESMIDQMSYEELRENFGGCVPLRPAVRDAVDALPCFAAAECAGGGRPLDSCPICLEGYLRGRAEGAGPPLRAQLPRGVRGPMAPEAQGRVPELPLQGLISHDACRAHAPLQSQVRRGPPAVGLGHMDREGRACNTRGSCRNLPSP
uniref:Uncharacterized protein n=1 Tax=Tetraselmis sp. GSL018 TaxID=582737 RepID=A0A061S686_9CHLO